MKAIRSDQLDALQAALELLPFPMAMVDTAGHILQANAAMRTRYGIEGTGTGHAIWSWAPNEAERRFRQQHAADFGRLFDLSGQLSFSCIDVIRGQPTQVQVLSHALWVDGHWHGYLALIHFPEQVHGDMGSERQLNALLQTHGLSLEVAWPDGSVLFDSRRSDCNQPGWLEKISRAIAGSPGQSPPAEQAAPLIRLNRNQTDAPIGEPLIAIMERIYGDLGHAGAPTETLLLIDASLHIREVLRVSLGYGSRDLPGQSVLDFVAGAFYREDLRIKLDCVRHGMKSGNARIPVFDAFGNIIWYQALLLPVVLDGCAHVLVAGHDITHRLHSEALLRERDALLAKSELASLVAHELNNPLAGIKNAFEILKLDCACCPVEQRAAPYFKLINDEIGRMQLIIRQLYGLYNPSDEEPIAISPLDIAGRALAILEGEYRRKNLSLAIHSPLTQEQRLWLPRNLLEQCLVNVLKNAIDYSPEKGEISLFINYKLAHVTFSVLDQGPGIDESAPLFEPFFSTRRDGKNNLGLGLSITKSLITKAGGTIQASNRSAGSALFNLSLPAQPATD